MTSPSPLFQEENVHPRPAPDGLDAVTPPEIQNGLNLTVGEGEVHAIMGPNGCGKRTLASCLLASPENEVTDGRILFHGDNITDWPTDVRAKTGLSLGFHYPQEIAGVSIIQFLHQALSARKSNDLSVLELRLATMDWMKRLGMDSSFVDRYLNEGFSGSEKKRNEIMQMAILEPDLAVLTETDFGLDIDALRVVDKRIREAGTDSPQVDVEIITHHKRLLDESASSQTQVIADGQNVAGGCMEIAERLVVTIDGRPVASLGPLSGVEGQVRLAHLVAQGLMTAPRRTGEWIPRDPIPVWSGSRVDRLLREIR